MWIPCITDVLSISSTSEPIFISSSIFLGEVSLLLHLNSSFIFILAASNALASLLKTCYLVLCSVLKSCKTLAAWPMALLTTAATSPNGGFLTEGYFGVGFCVDENYLVYRKLWWCRGDRGYGLKHSLWAGERWWGPECRWRCCLVIGIGTPWCCHKKRQSSGRL